MPRPLLAASQSFWKQRFRVPMMINGQIARDNPAHGIVCSNMSGIFQLHAWNVATGDLRQLTHDPHGNLMGAIAPDGAFVYTVLDPDGDQYGHFARIPFEGGTIQDLTPDFPQYPLFQLCVSAAGNRLAFAVPRAGDAGTDLYVIALDEQIGEPVHLFHDPIPGLHGRKRLSLSADGNILVFASNERNPAMVERLLAFDTHTGELLGELFDGPENSVSPGDFSSIVGDTRILATCHRGDSIQRLLWNPCTGEQNSLDWPLDGFVVPVAWTPDATQLVLYQAHEAGTRHIFYSLHDGSLQGLDYVSGLRWPVTFGQENILYVHSGERRPTEILAMEISTGKAKATVLSGGPIPPERPWTSVTFPSSDGTSIQAWLITPEGDGPFPTVVIVHSGPREQIEEGYAPDLQLWTDHGFAVFAINYRGSAGFGHAFAEQIIGSPGYWELEDIVAGRNWLIAQGIARAEAILITGWSYGGFLTLLALGKTPDLWAGGMAGYAIADWAALYEEAGQGVKMPNLFGGTPQEKPEQYRLSSPITYAEEVQAPLLIYQGRHDPGCPPHQIERYVDVLQELGKVVEIMWLDAGHGTLDTELAIATQERLLAFAHRVLNR